MSVESIKYIFTLHKDTIEKKQKNAKMKKINSVYYDGYNITVLVY